MEKIPVQEYIFDEEGLALAKMASKKWLADYKASRGTVGTVKGVLLDMAINLASDALLMGIPCNYYKASDIDIVEKNNPFISSLNFGDEENTRKILGQLQSIHYDYNSYKKEITYHTSLIGTNFYRPMRFKGEYWPIFAYCLNHSSIVFLFDLITYEGQTNKLAKVKAASRRLWDRTWKSKAVMKGIKKSLDAMKLGIPIIEDEE